jgi:ketosteroid isomerase-like protein
MDMNEQANTALIQKLYTAFSTGDIQTILDNVNSNAEWINYGPETIPYAGNFSGRIAQFFQAIGDSTTSGKVVAERFIAQDDTVVSLGRYTATVRSSGSEVDTPIAHLFRIRDGKVTSWIGFSDTAAVAAAHGAATRSAGR